jgi:hypothetical protein
MKTQAETIADLSARCAGPNEFQTFDRAFRTSLTGAEGSRPEGRRAMEAGTRKEAGRAENRLTA